MADIAIQAVVQAVSPAVMPATPLPGQCWIVGETPDGAWTGQPGAIAAWTSGGWRFVSPFEGMQAWSVADGVAFRRTGSAWIAGALTAVSLSVASKQVVGAQRARVPAPAGGATVDVQARATLAALITGLEAHGLFSAI